MLRLIRGCPSLPSLPCLPASLPPCLPASRLPASLKTSLRRLPSRCVAACAPSRSAAPAAPRRHRRRRQSRLPARPRTAARPRCGLRRGRPGRRAQRERGWPPSPTCRTCRGWRLGGRGGETRFPALVVSFLGFPGLFYKPIVGAHNIFL